MTEDCRLLRVFPRFTRATPKDSMAFVGEPPLFRPEADEVHISVTFTWDRAEGERLGRSWRRFYPNVKVGGPAYSDPGAEFVPGCYLREGYVITSRGCPRTCDLCFVPGREGTLRELPIRGGWDVCDNNLLACSREHVEGVFTMLAAQKHRPRFSGGLQADLIEPWVVETLADLRPECLWMAYDRTSQAGGVRSAIARLREAGLRQRQVGCYVLIGYDGDTLEAAATRLENVVEWGGLPFAMLYRPEEGRPNLEWRRFQRRWCRPAAILGNHHD